MAKFLFTHTHRHQGYEISSPGIPLRLLKMYELTIQTLNAAHWFPLVERHKNDAYTPNAVYANYFYDTSVIFSNSISTYREPFKICIGHDRRTDVQWWFVYPDTFVPGRYFWINELSGLLNRPLVRTWKSVPTLFVRTSEISGLSEPGLTNHHCNWHRLPMYSLIFQWENLKWNSWSWCTTSWLGDVWTSWTESSSGMYYNNASGWPTTCSWIEVYYKQIITETRATQIIASPSNQYSPVTLTFDVQNRVHLLITVNTYTCILYAKFDGDAYYSLVYIVFTRSKCDWRIYTGTLTESL